MGVFEFGELGLGLKFIFWRTRTRGDIRGKIGYGVGRVGEEKDSTDALRYVASGEGLSGKIGSNEG